MLRFILLPLFMLFSALPPVLAGLEPDLRKELPVKTVQVRHLPLKRASSASDHANTSGRVILRPSGEKAALGTALVKSPKRVSRGFGRKASFRGGVRHPQRELAPERFHRREARMSRASVVDRKRARVFLEREALSVQEAPVVRVQLDSPGERMAPAAVTLEELNRYVYRRDRPQDEGRPVPVTRAGEKKAD